MSRILSEQVCIQHKYETVSVDPKLLVNDLNPDKDDGKITWYPQPHFSFMKPGEDSEGTIKGPFGSVS